MSRVSSALTLIAVLLVCPYWCLSAAASRSASATMGDACSCCEHRREVPSRPTTENGPVPVEPAPSAPADGLAGDCLCHGAVLTHDDPLRDATATRAAFLAAGPLAESVPHLAGSREMRLHAGPPLSARLSGRLLCFVLESLLL